MFLLPQKTMKIWMVSNDSYIIHHKNRYTTKNILSGCFAAWFGNCVVQNCNKVQGVVDTAQYIMQTSLLPTPSTPSIPCYLGKLVNVFRNHSFGSFPLPTGRRYKCLKVSTTRFSFFLAVIRLLFESLSRK